jgi:hypothetical protein
MDLTREEAIFLNILNESGPLVVAENARPPGWDRLLASGYVTATTTSEDSVRFELTDAGRAALLES